MANIVNNDIASNSKKHLIFYLLTKNWSGIDPSFITKAGKKTPGLGYFWSGQARTGKTGS